MSRNLLIISISLSLLGCAAGAPSQQNNNALSLRLMFAILPSIMG